MKTRQDRKDEIKAKAAKQGFYKRRKKRKSVEDLEAELNKELLNKI